MLGTLVSLWLTYAILGMLLRLLRPSDSAEDVQRRLDKARQHRLWKSR